MKLSGSAYKGLFLSGSFFLLGCSPLPVLIQSKGSSLGPLGGPGLKSCLLAPPGSPKHYSISQPPTPEFSKALMGKTPPNPGLPSLDFHPAMDPGLAVLHSPTHSLEANVERGGGGGNVGNQLAQLLHRHTFDEHPHF